MILFDELNTGNPISSILEYFDEMDLPELEKKKRKAFAQSFFDAMLFIFALFSVMKQYNRINKEFIISQLQSRYSEIVLQYMDIDKYLEDYISNFSKETVDVTLRRIDEPFYLSQDRGILISVNEANNTLNYKDFLDAKENGKTRKQWITEKDKKVRKTHKILDDKTISIDDVFLVGDTFMRFPHDTLYGIDYTELSNCRCTIKYF